MCGRMPHLLIRPTSSCSLNYLLPATILLILQKLKITHKKLLYYSFSFWCVLWKGNFYSDDFYAVTINNYSKICMYILFTISRKRLSSNATYIAAMDAKTCEYFIIF